jgi:hypothetical protein
MTTPEQLARQLQVVKPAFAEEIEQTLRDILEEATSALADYPPERPGQKYIRTGDLGSVWNAATPVFQQRGRLFSVMATNDLPYAAYVQGPGPRRPKQAWMHRGRWDTTEQVKRDLEPLMQAEADRLAARIAKRIEDA